MTISICFHAYRSAKFPSNLILLTPCIGNKLHQSVPSLLWGPSPGSSQYDSVVTSNRRPSYRNNTGPGKSVQVSQKPDSFAGVT